MSRHSKWSKVKQFKGAIDAKRSASFTKLAREITVTAKEKGGDPNMNAGLRAAIQRAREASMPKDAIERAVSRGTGEGSDGAQIESLMYEAYGPGGIAFIIQSLTDNRNRTAGEIKHMLAKAGGSLAASGSARYLFDRVPQESGFEWVPKMLIEMDEESGSKAAELIDELEEHDDVSRVFSNLA